MQCRKRIQERKRMEKIEKNNIITKIKISLFFVYMLALYIWGADTEKVKYTEVILLVFLGLEGIEIIKNGKIKFCIPIIFLFCFTFFCFLSNFWAINSKLSIDKAESLLLLDVFILISYNFFINIENSEDIILKCIMYAGIFFSIYVLAYYGIGEYINRLMSGERMGAEIDNVNTIRNGNIYSFYYYYIFCFLYK